MDPLNNINRGSLHISGVEQRQKEGESVSLGWKEAFQPNHEPPIKHQILKAT